VSITLVHYFHAQTSTVEDVGPSRDDAVLTVDQRLIEIKPVEVESHRAHSEGGEPDPHNWPSSKKEVKRTRVIKRSILEDQTTKVTVGGNDVISFFLLTELVAVILTLGFGSLTN